MRLKFDTITGTGRAMTSTPLREHMDPNTFPTIVFGTMSPYLEHREQTTMRSLLFDHFTSFNAIFTRLELVTVTPNSSKTSDEKSLI